MSVDILAMYADYGILYCITYIIIYYGENDWFVFHNNIIYIKYKVNNNQKCYQFTF